MTRNVIFVDLVLSDDCSFPSSDSDTDPKIPFSTITIHPLGYSDDAFNRTCRVGRGCDVVTSIGRILESMIQSRWESMSMNVEGLVCGGMFLFHGSDMREESGLPSQRSSNDAFIASSGLAVYLCCGFCPSDLGLDNDTVLGVGEESSVSGREPARET